MLARALTRHPRLLLQPVRAFGGGGHHDHHHKHETYNARSKGTTFKHPSDADIDYQLHSTPPKNLKFQQWVQARWQVDQDDRLDNYRVNKFSAWYWLQNFSSDPLISL